MLMQSFAHRQMPALMPAQVQTVEMAYGQFAASWRA